MDDVLARAASHPHPAPYMHAFRGPKGAKDEFLLAATAQPSDRVDFRRWNRIVAGCKVFAMLRESVVSKAGTASKATGTGLETAINHVSY